MRANRLGFIVVVTLMGIGIVGCAKKDKEEDGPVGKVSQADADKMNAQHSAFDSAKDPKINANTRFAAGQLAESQNSPQKAIQQYREALKLEPEHQPSLFRLAVVYAQVKEYPLALMTWEKYIKATDGSAAGFSNLGFCYELAGKPDDAEAAYKKAIAKDAKYAPARVNFGLMLARNGRVNEATIQLQSVLSPAEVQYNLASVFEQLGRKDQARAAYQKAIELDPNMNDAKERLAALE